MKKLINIPEALVDEAVQGMALAYPSLRKLDQFNVLIYNGELPPRVACLSGGGSGHEPAHAGFVGNGMLSGAVAGQVFASPTVQSILAGIRALGKKGERGVLLIVKNYTGDRVNFGLAAKAAQEEHGIEVEQVIVGDDVALASLQHSEGPAAHAGRRGIAGTLFVHKIAGAAAAEGLSLPQVAHIASEVARDVRTMGVALSPCIVPAVGRPTFTLGENEMELGLGIHGEPGVQRTAIESADAVVDKILQRILADYGPTGPSSQRVVLLVNNLGGTAVIELAVICRRAIQQLEARHFTVERVYVGSFMTSLEMAGVSLSILPVDDGRLRRLDAPTDAPAWPNAANTPPRGPRCATLGDTGPVRSPTHSPGAARSPLAEKMQRIIAHVCAALKTAEPRLTALDAAVGDGDLGSSVKRIADIVLGQMASLPLDNPTETIRALADLIKRDWGGSSGVFYGVFLDAIVGKLAAHGGEPSLEVWGTALMAGVEAICRAGDSKVGDCTMIDALQPAVESLQRASTEGLVRALEEAVNAARKGAAATQQMVPRRGRASYMQAQAVGVRDPGAELVCVWLTALFEALNGNL